ncbi:hypothetical protein prwr041_04870 [Prevotella herbatica]|uniref:Uncharacterized protein n=1 Tax=Prevotella herbatica TaxID=2801997 RepID=A0ABM7NVR0_9BACT|nr:hypothetical protein prwr041_04870 [Prevotella herbatica]
MNFKLFAYLVAVIEFVYKHCDKECDKTIFRLVLEDWNAPITQLLTNDKSNHVNISQAYCRRNR